MGTGRTVFWEKKLWLAPWRSDHDPELDVDGWTTSCRMDQGSDRQLLHRVLLDRYYLPAFRIAVLETEAPRGTERPRIQQACARSSFAYSSANVIDHRQLAPTVRETI